MSPPSGPLAGLRVVEFGSIGPGPHCAMLLSDLGAEVLRIDREGGNGWPNPVVDRGRGSVIVDIRSDAGREYCLAALDCADVLIEGFRPGVMERLGLGPEVVLARNPRLIYSRMTGWGQTGPRAQSAGHDINFIAMTGALAAIGSPGEPAIPPLNLVGDFGGGSLYLAFGITAALWERDRSGHGQIIDAAIVDGVSSMMTMFSGLLQNNGISVARDQNLLAGAAPFYRCYICADGAEIAVGAIEPHFYEQLLALIGASPRLLIEQGERSKWPGHGAELATIFAARTAAEWEGLLGATDSCVARVLDLEDAPHDPHMVERGVYFFDGDTLQTAPAPRFSRTPGAVQPARHAHELLASWSAVSPGCVKGAGASVYPRETS